jgi:putative ABC transport system permease protein
MQPVSALKGKSSTVNNKHRVRKILLTIQFIISMVLIIGAVTLYQQLQYLHDKPLGFKKQEVIVVPIFGSGDNNGIGYGVDAAMRQRINLFENQLSAYSAIDGVSAASAMPGNGFVRGLVIPQGRSGKDNIFVPWISVDYNFLDVMKVPLIAGRNFSKARGTDHLSAFILNESAVRSFGWRDPDSAIGKNIIRGEESNGKKGQVIGVVRNFDFNSLDQPMEPMIMDVNAPRFSQFAISVRPGHMNETIGMIRKTWAAIFPDRVFEYNFLDKQIDNLYKDKENLSRIIGYFSVIAIFLSCSGLFGLASFLSVQRRREIAIRKTLGATPSNVLFLLSRDFVRIVFIAFIIAAPVAAYIIQKWLAGFAYRIPMPWWVFILTVLLVSLIAFITVSWQSAKAALRNPVKNLRTE